RQAGSFSIELDHHNAGGSIFSNPSRTRWEKEDAADLPVRRGSSVAASRQPPEGSNGIGSKKYRLPAEHGRPLSTIIYRLKLAPKQIRKQSELVWPIADR